ncbi:MAG TPA: hypothetical protein DEF30_04435 [Proteiniclasticum sp.]|uniref:hypothetical protein n=1 Tax=Proteiniclasticum sp. TaxID=2053595 RepID=UPI000E9A5008|nr:hypothetical protein [Proteiniclasticum sp.]HBW13059.1 hypothetical protein [Proteiniclasticum sp.]
MISRKYKLFFFSLLILSTILISVIFVTQGRFLITNTSSISIEAFEVDYPVYLGNSLNWTGTLKPRIVDIKLLDSNKEKIAIGNTPIEVFIVEDGYIGVVTENDISTSIDFFPTSNYLLLDDNFNIVFRLDSDSDKQFLENITGIWIDFSIFGINKSNVVDISLIEN